LERIIPSPTKVWHEPMNGENFCICVAFEGRVPRNKDEHSEYVCPREQVFTANLRERKKCQHICNSVRTTTKEWFFDTGATLLVTPYKYLLFNTSICYREIKVANGRHVQVNLVGDLLLKSECGNYLYLQGVLYSPLFNKNIISTPPANAKQGLYYYYERQLRGDAVLWYWSQDRDEASGEFIYIYWMATAGICIKIPGTKYYEK
jgi:hypothetical protein